MDGTEIKYKVTFNWEKIPFIVKEKHKSLNSVINYYKDIQEEFITNEEFEILKNGGKVSRSDHGTLGMFDYYEFDKSHIEKIEMIYTQTIPINF